MALWPLLMLLLALSLATTTTAASINSGGLGPASATRKYALNQDSRISLRCSGVRGSWCEDFAKQQPIPWKAAPRGDTSCPNNCNGVGRCNYDIGYCDCPAGATGVDCSTPQKRPCTNALTQPRQKDLSSWKPVSYIGADMRDLNLTNVDTFTDSRCSGICDDDLGMCYCDGPMGRIPPAPGSKPGSPPIREGRPMATSAAQPKRNKDGQPMWGSRDWDDIYGPNGWCNASKPSISLPCIIDGLEGPYCEEPIEQYCPGQCAGHGTCVLGFCKCDSGYYGHDCARRRKGLPLQPSVISERKWLSDVVGEVVAALDPPPAPTRKRPLIYVYDLEPLYQSKMLQLRIPAFWCVHRRYVSGNSTVDMDVWVYATELVLHEVLLASAHRTFDPEEADYFYVPHAAICFSFPIMNWADWPWFHEPNMGVRPMHMANIILDTKRWIQKHFPFWDRRGGRDHIFFMEHDEGACWAPNEITPAIWLTHWGRTDLNHKSQTAHQADNYDHELRTPRFPKGWQHHTNITGHACYRPGQDLLLPSYKSPEHYKSSALQGKPARERDIFLLFRGDVGKKREPHYSRGVRQMLHRMARDGGWMAKYGVHFGDRVDVPGDYSDLLSRSKYCAVIGGDGWSARAEDAVLHGCIPVSIQDQVEVVYESILDFSKFGIIIPEKDANRTLEILQAVPPKKLMSLQAHLGRVWHRYRWASTPYMKAELIENLQKNSQEQLNLESASQAHLGSRDEVGLRDVVSTQTLYPRPFRGDPTTDDAFATLMQWLYHRIPFTR